MAWRGPHRGQHRRQVLDQEFPQVLHLLDHLARGEAPRGGQPAEVLARMEPDRVGLPAHRADHFAEELDDEPQLPLDDRAGYCGGGLHAVAQPVGPLGDHVVPQVVDHAAGGQEGRVGSAQSLPPFEWRPQSTTGVRMRSKNFVRPPVLGSGQPGRPGGAGRPAAGARRPRARGGALPRARVRAATGPQRLPPLRLPRRPGRRTAERPERRHRRPADRRGLVPPRRLRHDPHPGPGGLRPAPEAPQGRSWGSPTSPRSSTPRRSRPGS